MEPSPPSKKTSAPQCDQRGPSRKPLTRVLFAGQASRTSLDKLENRLLSAELAQYLAHALAIASGAEAKVIHVDIFGLEHSFSARPADELPVDWERCGVGVAISLDCAITARFPAS